MSDSKIALPLAVVTVSDTRTEESDKSGGVLVGCLEEAGHKLHSKQIVKDDVYQLRAEVSRLIADPGVKGVLMTGGTGFTDRDNTPESYPAFTGAANRRVWRIVSSIVLRGNRHFDDSVPCICRSVKPNNRILSAGVSGSLSYGMGKHYSIPAG